MTGPTIRIVYPDGSCLNCQFGYGSNPAFRPGGTVISFIQNGGVALDKIDGNPESGRMPGSVSDAVWSAAGRLAVVRGGAIWAGRPGRLTRIGIGSEPSWSPNGAMIAAAQHGWIVIIRLRDHRVRRLVRGAAPAFAPDGRWIAYVAPHDRLMIVRASGARLAPRRAGNIHAISVDWQPKPRRSHPACLAPPGSSVLASSPAAVVTGDGLPPPALGFWNGPSIAYMGCLRADGRERLLERFDSNTVDGAYSVGSAVVAAPYAGLVLNYVDQHYGGQSSALQIFDLRTGLRQPKLGGESACPGQPQMYSDGPCVLDQVVLGSDGVSAADSRAVSPVGSFSTELEHVACAPASTTCVVTDRFHVFSSTNPTGGAKAWTAATIAPSGPSGIDCPSASLCVGSNMNIFTTTHPTGGAPAWRSTPLTGTPAYINGVSCPSTHLCVAIRIDGSVATSTDPTGGTGAWSIREIDSDRFLTAIFCSSQPECFSTDYVAGTVFHSADPTGGASAWTVSTSTPPFVSGTCPTVSFCVAVGNHDIQTTTDPGAGTWTKHAVADYLDGVACPSTALCLAIGAGGALYVSTNPASGAWTQTTIDAGRFLRSIACPSASLCIAVDSTGHAVSSTDPTGGPSAWTPALLEGDPCADTTPCSVEQIQTSDATGRHTVDSSKVAGAGPFLTGLTLTGDVLSWNHDGTQKRSVTLTP